ncbi:hypothetical protein V5H98_04570 [Georgenia sp. M64]|uniref:hypothetical protein n=1 Tax=Georgenia sp. M64 TaxID=3120520 RepID=UPI0030DF2A76
MVALRTVMGVCTVTALMVLLAGCTEEPAPVPDEPTSSASAREPISIRDALDRVEAGEQVRVQTTLVTEDGVPFLCDSVADSDPEQCSEPSVEIVGAPLDDLELTERRGELAGEVDIVITIEDRTATFVGPGMDSGGTAEG